MNAILKEWRDARQDIFDNASKISEENTKRWERLTQRDKYLLIGFILSCAGMLFLAYY